MTADTRNDRDYLTPPEVARLLRVRESKVAAWIRTGQLVAINLSEGRRPRYRVRRTDLEAYLEQRAVVPESKPATRQRREAVPRYV
jgi:excisionase family DNA binding protein